MWITCHAKYLKLYYSNVSKDDDEEEVVEWNVWGNSEGNIET